MTRARTRLDQLIQRGTTHRPVHAGRRRNGSKSVSTREFRGLVLPAQLAGCARRRRHWRYHGQIRIRATALLEQAVAQIENLSLRGHGALLDASCQTPRQAKSFARRCMSLDGIERSVLGQTLAAMEPERRARRRHVLDRGTMGSRYSRVGEHVSDDAERKVRAMAPTLAPVAEAPERDAARLALAATIPPTAGALGHASTMLGIEQEARPRGGIGTDATMMGLPAKTGASIGSDPTMMGLPAKAAASIGSDPTMMGLPAKAGASIGSAPTMMGLPAKAASIGSAPTMMGLPAKAAASIGSAPTMMGLPAKAASIGSAPTMMSLPAKAASIGSAPTIAGLPAEPLRPSTQPQPVPVPLAAPPSPRTTSLPLVTPTMAPVAPPRPARALLIAGAVAAVLVVGGITWAALRDRPSHSATIDEPSPQAQDGSKDAPAAAPADAPAPKRALKPPPDPELTKSGDEKEGGRSRRRRPFGRFGL
jgi:hypothetical protein